MYNSSAPLAFGYCKRNRGAWLPLIGALKGKIVLDQVDLEKAQNEDGALIIVRSWFNETTGKIDDKKIDTSEFDSVHGDVLQLYKVRKQLRLTDKKTTSKTRLI